MTVTLSDAAKFKLFHRHTCVPEMRFGNVLSASHSIYAPLKECLEALLWILFILVPSFPDKSFQHSKEFLDGVKIWRVRRQIHKFHSCFGAQLCYTF